MAVGDMAVGDMATGHGTWMDAFMEDHYGPVLGVSETALGNFSFLLVCAFVFSVCLYSPHLFWPMEASSPASLMRPAADSSVKSANLMLLTQMAAIHQRGPAVSLDLASSSMTEVGSFLTEECCWVRGGYGVAHMAGCVVKALFFFSLLLSLFFLACPLGVVTASLPCGDRLGCSVSSFFIWFLECLLGCLSVRSHIWDSHF